MNRSLTRRALYAASLVCAGLLTGCAVTDPTDQDTSRVRSAIVDDPATPIALISQQLGVADAAVLEALPQRMRRRIAPEQWRTQLGAVETWGEVQVQMQHGEHLVELDSDQVGLLNESNESLRLGDRRLAIDLHIPDIDSMWLINKPSLRGEPMRGLIVCDDGGTARLRVLLRNETSSAFDEAWAQVTQ